MRTTVSCLALSVVLISASAGAEQGRPAPGARTQVLRKGLLKKASFSQYRLPSSFSGERCFEWRIRSRWDLCSP
jgi:hypothetical protein